MTRRAPRHTRRRTRPLPATAGLIVGAAVVLAACSGGDQAPAAATDQTSVAESTSPAGSTETTAAPAAGVVESTVPQRSEVRLEATIGQDTTVLVGDPTVSGPEGVFGTFAACSGLRSRVGAYAVIVSQPPEAISLTISPVAGPGSYDVDLVVERGGTAISAAGGVTLDAGLQSGTFAAQTGDGVTVLGSFSCTGADSPALLDDPDEPAIEIVALLRRGEAERALVTTATASDATSLACDPSSRSVTFLGEDSVGSVTGFDLAEDGSLSIVGGGVEYAFDAVAVADAADGAAAFEATSGDVRVDGAFRCLPTP